MNPATINLVKVCIFLLAVMLGGAVSAQDAKQTTTPAIPDGMKKADVDAAARGAGYKNADYPYHEHCNGCGSEDWESVILNNPSLILSGDVNYLIGILKDGHFKSACDQHDKDYMTIGMSKDDADKKLKVNLEKAVNDYLEESITRTIKVPGTKTITKRIPKKITDEIKVPFMKRVGPWWNPIYVPDVRIKRQVKEIWEDVTVTVEELMEQVETVHRITMLTQGQIKLLRLFPEIYYQGVRRLGGESYQKAQCGQKKYEDWLNTYFVNK